MVRHNTVFSPSNLSAASNPIKRAPARYKRARAPGSGHPSPRHVSAHSLAASLATAALLHSACAAPKKVGDQCTTESQGSLLGTPHNLPAVYIRPGVQDASVDIPNQRGGGEREQRASERDMAGRRCPLPARAPLITRPAPANELPKQINYVPCITLVRLFISGRWTRYKLCARRARALPDMSPLARSLLALAAAALLHGACVEADASQCTTVIHGVSSSAEYDLVTVYIPAGVQASTVTIPNPCKYGNTPIGELVMVCDDVKPTVYVPDLPQYSPATVYRNGDYTKQAAPVSVIIWCPAADPPTISFIIVERVISVARGGRGTPAMSPLARSLLALAAAALLHVACAATKEVGD
ncbi:hypothetical protein MSG28_001876 [Choristoneura fumiferana]|uniref:Uncharacterized protein n=1 Tax=Choristoneura fumiferana TaxID=7141 RepID=A0ACC0JT68_CHOFU|nr:hypothetical protein MSG28_001876 [Choristoneura fumiferana]